MIETDRLKNVVIFIQTTLNSFGIEIADKSFSLKPSLKLQDLLLIQELYQRQKKYIYIIRKTLDFTLIYNTNNLMEYWKIFGINQVNYVLTIDQDIR